MPYEHSYSSLLRHNFCLVNCLLLDSFLLRFRLCYGQPSQSLFQLYQPHSLHRSSRSSFFKGGLFQSFCPYLFHVSCLIASPGLVVINW